MMGCHAAARRRGRARQDAALPVLRAVPTVGTFVAVVVPLPAGRVLHHVLRRTTEARHCCSLSSVVVVVTRNGRRESERRKEEADFT